MSATKRKCYKPSYQQNQTNKYRHRFALEAGMKGFLCTCNFQEQKCVVEAYSLLNEFSEKMESPKAEQKPAEKLQENEDSDDDISMALEKEINELKEENKKPLNHRKFQAVETGAKNVIFIKSTVEDPLKLVTTIIEEIQETKKQRARFILRLIPIQVICKAYMDEIITKASILFDEYFVQEPKTFSIVFNRHNNNNVERMKVIDELAKIIAEKNAGNKADLKNPELAVVVEVIRNMCLISIAPKYFTYKKYNLLELCNVNAKEGDEKVSQESNDETKKNAEIVKEDVQNDESMVKEVENINRQEVKEENIQEEKVEIQENTEEKKEDLQIIEGSKMEVEAKA